MANNFILRGVDFQLGYTDYHSSLNSRDISRDFNEKHKRLTDSEFSYRIINHWESNNLLSSYRSSEKGWRKYSLLDLVWVFVIKELRKFGFSLEDILKVKKSLNEKRDNENAEFPLLEYYVALGLMNKPVYLLVFENGEAHPVTEWEYQLTREFNSIENHIQISLNTILEKLLPKSDLKPNYKDKNLPTPDERRIIWLLRIKSFKEVVITQDDGDTGILNENMEDVDSKVDEIIRQIYSGEYLSIRLKDKDEKVISVQKNLDNKVMY